MAPLNFEKLSCRHIFQMSPGIWGFRKENRQIDPPGFENLTTALQSEPYKRKYVILGDFSLNFLFINF